MITPPKRNTLLHTLSLLIFVAGILIAMVVAAGIAWSNLEASLFDSSIASKEKLGSLNCPVFITPNEVGIVSATLHNPTEQEKTFYIRTHISEGFVTLKREFNDKIPVPPGEESEVKWEVYAKDAAYDRIVMFRTYVNTSYPLPSMGNFCGILLVNVPWLTGSQVFYLSLVLSLIFVVGGNWWWRKLNAPLEGKMLSVTNAMVALAVIAYGAIAAVLLGQWLVGAILVAISVLAVGVIFGRIYSLD